MSQIAVYLYTVYCTIHENGIRMLRGKYNTLATEGYTEWKCYSRALQGHKRQPELATNKALSARSNESKYVLRMELQRFKDTRSAQETSFKCEQRI